MLTSLFISLSLIGVTVWGFFFWNTPFTLLVGLGLVLVVTAVTLCLYKGKGKDSKEQEKSGRTISFKWIVFVLLAFVGNAGATIVQRTQQMACNGQHGNLLMFIATGLASVAFAIAYMVKDASDFKKILKTTGYFPMIAGGCNFGLNLFVILLASSSLSPSLIYPVMSVGSLACITVASIFLFKEKMKWWQWLGVAIGATAVAILSL
jgi:drug/metabolite transporter (DMT)-like permease